MVLARLVEALAPPLIAALATSEIVVTPFNIGMKRDPISVMVPNTAATFSVLLVRVPMFDTPGGACKVSRTVYLLPDGIDHGLRAGASHVDACRRSRTHTIDGTLLGAVVISLFSA